MNKPILIIVLTLVGCYNRDETRICYHELRDHRWNDTANYFYFRPGTYWVYRDTFSGLADSQYVMESSYQDNYTDLCEFDYFTRKGGMKVFSTYYNDTIFYNIKHEIGPSGDIVEIREGDSFWYVGFSRMNLSKDTIIKAGNAMYKCRLYGGHNRARDNYFITSWGFNIGVVKRTFLHVDSGYIPFRNWELERYYIVR